VVPPSLVTNDPVAVAEFATEHEQDDLIIKPLAFNSITEGGSTRALYTHRLTEHDLDDLTGVSTTTLFLQCRIAKDYEVRLTMVGGEPFAAAIHADSDDARVDWRTDVGNTRISVATIPDVVLDAVVAFMRTFSITFGAFDFAVTPEGRWVLFECNGAGQWGFVEAATGLPITAAVSALLERGMT
jgi:glutathione synthase/RimK-type ligase-like ATP-grasp enzyme